MYFKRLEIFGFKSFADKTVLNFEPGITAVIGPNGCGKSNIFDAIRWVLGEQSVKELRGSSMEDVIFNGTDKKPALGFAEVSVTFSNESRALPVDYNEVTVTRRLFRSGESEYLLNKTTVRLKDITELFLGTGVGAEAYSLVQQGKVDLVVSAKPEDRRAILDEASGITKYKARRREAMNKLKDTDNNLLRINDIVVEVKRQIATLERQANKARRYKDEFEKLKGMEVQFANLELNDQKALRDELRRRLESLRQKESRLAEEVAQFNEQIEQETYLMEELEDKINEVNADSIKLDGQIDICERQIEFNQERIDSHLANEKRLQEKKVQLSSRVEVQNEKIEEVRRVLSEVEQTMQGNLQKLNEKKQALEVIARSLEEARGTIRLEEEKIMDVTSNQVHVKNRLTEIMKEVQGCLARKRRLEMEDAKVTGEKNDVDQRLTDIKSKLEASSSRLNELKVDLEARRQTMDDQLADLSGLEKDIDDLEKKTLFLNSQKEFIEKMSVQYQDMPDPAVDGRFFTASPPNDKQTGIIGKVKDVIPLDEARRRAMGEVFPGDPQNFCEIVCEAKFVELDPMTIGVQIEALSLQIQEKSAQREELAARIKQEKAELGEVEFNLHQQEKTFSIYQSQQNDVLGECDKLNEELELVKSELDEVTGALTKHKIAESDLIRHLDSLNQELSFCQLRIKEKQEWIAGKSREREEATIVVAQVETELSSIEDRRRTHNDNLKLATEVLENCQSEMQGIDEDCRNMETQREEFLKGIEVSRAKIVALQEDKESLRGVLSQYEEQKNELNLRLESVRTNVKGLTEEIESIRNDLHNEQMGEQELAFHEKEIKDRLMQTYRIDLDIANREAAEARAAEVKAAEEAGTEPPAQPQVLDREEMETAITRLRKRCDSFGSVNLVAIEEFEELRERFEFLTKQQSDLITAKESLHQTIRKINRQTRQMFLDTFTKVSEEFRIYFRMLFGGGDAQLVLLDPENVLESGIDIVARPPGKKLQNISLLSGGEKTLTAIGLIFGVFKVNPSPFCVLDEIDAALDESNVGRYSYLLKDFAKIAQFIVITHNKKTIASANVMYGITMQETGVSKIVSVKFGDKEDKAAEDVDMPVAV